MGVIPSVLDFVGGMINTGLGFYQDAKNNEIAKMNFDIQRRQQNYEKRMQAEAWKREDNATQRRVVDLKAAGLNPVLAAGSAAQSSAPIHLSTPQRENVQTGTGFNRLADALSMMSMKANIAQTQSQNELIQFQKAKAIAETQGIAIDNEKNRYNLNYYKKWGLPTDSPGIAKNVTYAADTLKQGIKGTIDKVSGGGESWNDIANQARFQAWFDEKIQGVKDFLKKFNIRR